MPFGFDAVFWQLMGDGIDWMIRVALWVNNLPGAVGRIQAFGTGPLLIGTAGLLLVCLLRTPLRWSGAALVIAGGLWAISTPRPDVLVAGDGQAAVARGSDGRLSVIHSGRDSFAIKEWLAADADARTPKDPSLGNGVTCDAIGCVGKLRDGRFVSVALAAEAFAEDCARVAIIVSQREAPSPNCAATLIDRKISRAYGAVALRWTGDHFEQSVTHAPGHERPWTQSPAVAGADGAQPRSPRSDATPRSEDLDAGD
jgi:competence protein ComEC